MNYSVLMSVYYKEKAEWLLEAMESIWNQTEKTDDFVLVCDGPLNEDLESVIHEMEIKHSDVLHVIRLNKNSGLGNALNIGLQNCKNNLIARMDSDDISRPNRCKQQIELFQKNQDLSICSGIVEEFTNNPQYIDSQRIPPENHNQILSFIKKRNPFNHPCVMYRKSAVEAAGGYQDFYLLEDYFLWIRMIRIGCIGYNIQQPLLWMRAGHELYKRRSGWKYTRSQIALCRYMKDIHFLSSTEYYMICFVRSVFSLMPNAIREIAYTFFLRKRRHKQL